MVPSVLYGVAAFLFPEWSTINTRPLLNAGPLLAESACLHQTPYPPAGSSRRTGRPLGACPCSPVRRSLGTVWAARPRRPLSGSPACRAPSPGPVRGAEGMLRREGGGRPSSSGPGARVSGRASPGHVSASAQLRPGPPQLLRCTESALGFSSHCDALLTPVTEIESQLLTKVSTALLKA